jgi:transcriptional regulator with PAS, ATPase and Fis domain
MYSGNLARSSHAARLGLEEATLASLSIPMAGSLCNLGLVSILLGYRERARQCLEQASELSGELSIVRLSILDSLAQLGLFNADLADVEDRLADWHALAKTHTLPARSWYDFAHQITRCAYFEHLEDWDTIIATADDADPELVRRQYKAIRTTLLCAKARALARLGRHGDADSVLAAAVRTCPRGAVDPLLVLEASKALCASLRGDSTRGAVHYDRALAGCRAIGHRYHEAWIERDRAGVRRHTRESVAVAPRTRDLTETSLVLSDVSAILGAGHSIDLLAQRTAEILRGTTMADRVEVRSESGQPYRPEPSAHWDIEADSTITIRLRGSDRRVAVRVRGVESIEEVSLLKSLTDILQAAVNRTADTETEDEDLNLWPRVVVHNGEDTIFRSPRMVELVRIAERLAATTLPILITGETGTGKEIIARLIHEGSAARRGPFVAFNCSAMPRELVESQLFGHRRGAFTGALDSFPGVIRAAEKGTLFLDEIGDLDPTTQPKLLRFLESGEIHPVGEARAQRVPVRIVAATNANLEELADQGRFRRDLFYRIGVARIAMPPLRDRKDEIPALASLFLARYARECGRSHLRLGDDFIAALLLHDWPGNIRQLANEIRRAAAMAADGQTLTAADLAPDVAAPWNARPIVPTAPAGPTVEVRLDQPLPTAVADLERRFIAHAMTAADGRVAEAAHLLGLSRKGLFLKRRRRGFLAG